MKLTPGGSRKEKAVPTISSIFCAGFSASAPLCSCHFYNDISSRSLLVLLEVGIQGEGEVFLGCPCSCAWASARIARIHHHDAQLA